MQSYLAVADREHDVGAECIRRIGARPAADLERGISAETLDEVEAVAAIIINQDIGSAVVNGIIAEPAVYRDLSRRVANGIITRAAFERRAGAACVVGDNIVANTDAAVD